MRLVRFCAIIKPAEAASHKASLSGAELHPVTLTVKSTQRRGSCPLTGCFGGGLEKKFWRFVRESYFIFVQGGFPLKIILQCQPKLFSNKRKMQLNANGTNQNLTCLYCMLFMFTASVRKWCDGLNLLGQFTSYTASQGTDEHAVDITARR